MNSFPNIVYVVNSHPNKVCCLLCLPLVSVNLKRIKHPVRHIGTLSICVFITLITGPIAPDLPISSMLSSTLFKRMCDNNDGKKENISKNEERVSLFLPLSVLIERKLSASSHAAASPELFLSVFMDA